MEEKKEYSIVGTVTIGTDEYRDLITEKFEAEKKAAEENDRWYKEYRRANDLEKEVKELNAKVEQLRKYIKDKDEQDEFELWIIKTSRED